MDDPKAQLADKLKSANNILVTVSRDPSVDQLASCIGLTLLLNKQGKHAAAVFSGAVPSTIEFLQPEDTLERTTDSLRDFIVSLDKSKADKLRYKVEDDVVRIFITPYRTSISEADLTFTQGDFNVDVVVALGVHLQEDLDEAITAHGRILHDATLAAINTTADGGLGTINWNDEHASSLSELVTDLAKLLGASEQLDGQIATALLTGIIAETDRFSNEKTSSQTMNASAVLMAAGANQQLVATQLAAPPDDRIAIQDEGAGDGQATENDDGLLEIDHAPEGEATGEQSGESYDDQASEVPELPLPGQDAGNDTSEPSEQWSEPTDPPSGITVSPGARMIVEPPVLSEARGNGEDGFTGLPNEEAPVLFNKKVDSVDASGAPAAGSWLVDPAPADPAATSPAPEPAPAPTPEPMPAPAPEPAYAPPPPAWTPPATPPQPAPVPAVPAPDPAEPPVTEEVANHTLAELERDLQSPHVTDPAHLDAARDEVSRALNDGNPGVIAPTEPVQALGAQPLGGDLHPADQAGPYLHDILGQPAPASFVPPAPDPVSPMSPNPQPPEDPLVQQPQVIDPTAPPPVPPPIPFQFGNPPSQQ